MRPYLVPALLALVLLTPSVAARAATPQTLTATVGPAFNISLKAHSKTVKTLAPGAYIIVVHDNSSIHNFHLIGPGVNKKTRVGAKGKSTWRLTLRTGTYRFVCDPHATLMKGKFIVRAP